MIFNMAPYAVGRPIRQNADISQGQPLIFKIAPYAVGRPIRQKARNSFRKTKGLGNGKPREVREHLGPPLLRIEVEAADIEKNSRKHIVLITFGAPACSGAFGCPGGTLGGRLLVTKKLIKLV